MTTLTSQTLRDAVTVLVEAGHTTGTFFDYTTGCFCLAGAVGYAAVRESDPTDKGAGSLLTGDELAPLAAVIKERFPDRYNSEGFWSDTTVVYEFNDNKNTSLADIFAVLTEAANRLETT